MASGGNAFKVSKYYHTEWCSEDGLLFRVDGLNMDAVYESLVRQIAGDALQANAGESLKESVEWDEKKAQLQKQIAVLEAKIKKETQPKKKFELVQQLRALQITEI